MNPVLLKPEGDTRSQVGRRRRRPPRSHRGAVAGTGPAPVAGHGRGLRRAARRARTRARRGRRQPGRDQPPRPRQQPGRSPTPTPPRCSSPTSTGAGRSPTSSAPGRWCRRPPARLSGFVLNKFRGDAALLEPGPGCSPSGPGWPTPACCRCSTTGCPTRRAPPSAPHRPARRRDGRRRPLPVRLEPRRVAPAPPRRDVRVGRRPADLDGADLVMLPGSKHVAADAAWLRQRGLDEAVARPRRRRRRVLGVCGGRDAPRPPHRRPDGVEGATRARVDAAHTEMAPAKMTRRSSVTFRALPAPWASVEASPRTATRSATDESPRGDADTEGAPQVVRRQGPGHQRPRPAPGPRRPRGMFGARRGECSTDVRSPRRRRRDAPRRPPARPARRVVTAEHRHELRQQFSMQRAGTRRSLAQGRSDTALASP